MYCYSSTGLLHQSIIVLSSSKNKIMVPNKVWMNLLHDRAGEEYGRGVAEFLNYAFQRNGGKTEIRCPCIRCVNARLGNREVVGYHLKMYGILPSYTFWNHHGERLGESTGATIDNIVEPEMHQLLHDLHPDISNTSEAATDWNDEDHDVHDNEPNMEAKRFYKLVDESKKPAYNGCKSSKLSLLVKLLHIKTVGNWSNESFTMLLQLLKEDVLPKDSLLPDSYYEAKKIIADLGLTYIKVDACQNSCMLYWKDDEKLDECRVCKTSRWKSDKHNGDVIYKANGKKLPVKTLRYFPLKPRLQRLFMSSKTASLMTWHHDKGSKDNVMRHPADSQAWKSFSVLHPQFSNDPRNVRLALASDGFQPFSNSKTPHSIWPVVLIPYNFPPWMIMKSSNFIISMLIPGPESPGDAIDIFLQPLIEEMVELWETGITTFDCSNRQNFQLHAALMWTINDFPAYGNLSGWSTKGKMACPVCNMDTSSMWLDNGGKCCYMGHRRWLSNHHRWRGDDKSFDGTKEKGVKPRSFSGDDLLRQMDDLEGIVLTRCPKTKVKISHSDRGDNWNKKSIFFRLPYWSSHLVRHNLDVMHIEKNICDSVLGTIMGLPGKTKDTLKTRLDLEALGIRQELHPIQQGSKVILPSAIYTLSQDMKREICGFLKQLKVSDGFSSNISQCVNVNERKITGLKSHDCHVLLQHLIPLAIRGRLPKETGIMMVVIWKSS
ncbi:hypothetical protein LINPERPRIM_LOCUS17285 [Linum perenne]